MQHISCCIIIYPDPCHFRRSQSLRTGALYGDTSARVAYHFKSWNRGIMMPGYSRTNLSDWGPGPRSRQLDGTNSYIYVYNDQSLQLSAQLTIETWMNF